METELMDNPQSESEEQEEHRRVYTIQEEQEKKTQETGNYETFDFSKHQKTPQEEFYRSIFVVSLFAFIFLGVGFIISSAYSYFTGIFGMSVIVTFKPPMSNKTYTYEINEHFFTDKENFRLENDGIVAFYNNEFEYKIRKDVVYADCYCCINFILEQDKCQFFSSESVLVATEGKNDKETRRKGMSLLRDVCFQRCILDEREDSYPRIKDINIFFNT